MRLHDYQIASKDRLMGAVRTYGAGWMHPTRASGRRESDLLALILEREAA